MFNKYKFVDKEDLKRFKELGYDLSTLEQEGLAYAPITDRNGNHGLIFQEDVCSDKEGYRITNVTFNEAKKLAEEQFRNLVEKSILKESRLPTSGEWAQLYRSPLDFRENIWTNAAADISWHEWTEGIVKKGVFYDKKERGVKLPESGYIYWENFAYNIGIPLKTKNEPPPSYEKGRFCIDKDLDETAILHGVTVGAGFFPDREKSRDILIYYSPSKEFLQYPYKRVGDSIGFRCVSSI